MEASGHLWDISGASGRQLGGRRRLGGIWEAEMLVLLCVCKGHCSRTVYFAIVPFDFFTTAPRIKIEILSLLCVVEGHFSKTLCFAIAVFDFFTTAPSIKIEMLILLCVFEGRFSKNMCFFSRGTPRNRAEPRSPSTGILPYGS